MSLAWVKVYVAKRNHPTSLCEESSINGAGLPTKVNYRHKDLFRVDDRTPKLSRDLGFVVF